jgi:hypothetical protein
MGLIANRDTSARKKRTKQGAKDGEEKCRDTSEKNMALAMQRFICGCIAAATRGEKYGAKSEHRKHIENTTNQTERDP